MPTTTAIAAIAPVDNGFDEWDPVTAGDVEVGRPLATDCAGIGEEEAAEVVEASVVFATAKSPSFHLICKG